MKPQVKMAVVAGATVLMAGIGYKVLGGNRRERILATLAGGMAGFGVSRFVTGMVADAPTMDATNP